MPKLYVAATPIGNLGDISPRLKDALSDADLIAAEDTRVTLKLLNYMGIKKPMLSCHRHNEDMRSESIISRMLDEDLTVALTCDAGTPAISDPGQLLVAAAWDADIEIVPIPGPSAAITALSCSGFDAREFSFYGFMPRERQKLIKKLESIEASGISIAVMYESPHRIVDLVKNISSTWPDCRICVCCDLTKKFELITRGMCSDVLAGLSKNPNVEKGEYCLVVEVPVHEKKEDVAVKLNVECFIMKQLLDGSDIDDAIAAASNNGYSRNEIYRAKIKIINRFEL